MDFGEVLDKRIGEHIKVKTGLPEFGTVTDVRPRQNVDGVVVVDVFGVVDGTNHDIHELIAPDNLMLYPGDRVLMVPVRGKDEYAILQRVTHDARQQYGGDTRGEEESWHYSRLSRVWRAMFGGKNRVRHDLRNAVYTLHDSTGNRTVHIEDNRVTFMQGEKLALDIDLSTGTVYVNGDLHVNGTVYSNFGQTPAGTPPAAPAEPVDVNPPIESEPT